MELSESIKARTTTSTRSTRSIKARNTASTRSTSSIDFPGILYFTTRYWDHLWKRDRPRVVQNRIRYTPSSVILTLIFPTHHNPSSPLYQNGLPWGEPCRGRGEATPRVGRKRSQARKKVPRCSGKAHAVPRQCASGGKGSWFGCAGPECRPNKRKMWVRESWRSISRSQDGSESPTQCVLYSTAMTPPRPRTDWCPVIFSTSSRWRGTETSS